MKLWRLVIEYGPAREELGWVQLRATEFVADEAARALLRVMSRRLEALGWAYGVTIRMDGPALR